MDTIIGILMSLGILGIFGFLAFWFGVALKSGPSATKDSINNDPRFR